MSSSRALSCPWAWCAWIGAAAWLFVIWTPSLLAQDEKGCEGVGFTREPSLRYSPNDLQERLNRNPKDVDALIHLGIHLEEQGRIAQAEALFERAIQAKPDCYLGYYFAGLSDDRMSLQASSDAEVNVLKALNLNPSLKKDGNIQAFISRHPRRQDGISPGEKETPSAIAAYVSSGNQFVIGVGAGFLLATPFLYFARRKQRASPSPQSSPFKFRSGIFQ